MAERTNPHANLIIGAQDEASPVFDKIKASSQSMAAGVEQAAAKAGKATDGMGDGAEKGAEKFTRAESLMRAAIMKSTRELELLGKTASQRFEAQIDFKGLEKAKFQEAISGLQAMESALSVAKAREAEFAAQNGFSLKAAQAKELVKASEYARWWAQELEKVEAAEKRLAGQNSFINSLKSQADAIGKTKADLLEMQAAQMGVAAQAAPFIAKMREADAGIGKMGMSAKQTTAALRQVPTQFTDIVVSLQGGQSAMQVFLQQGGQLKDMFGGAGNAARALGGYVLGLVNPFTIAAAAVAGIAVAYNQGAKEADAYRAALITTGNAAGTNAAQLKSYAQEISSVVGTQGKAAEALSALAATGKVGAENLREAAQAAVAYERATGQAASKTAEQFASLRNEPLAAVLKLNEGMNFLTDSTYKQIKSLEEQGKTAEAANVAQRAFADTLAGRAGEMERNLGTVERGWLAVKDAAKSAWDAILNVGRASTSVDQLSDVRKQIAARENQLANDGFGSNGGGAAFGRPSSANSARLSAELTALKAQAAALEGVAFASKTAAEAERQRGESVKASAAFDKAGERFLTDKVKMERELAVARTQGAEAGRSQAEIEKRLGEIRASYAKKGGGGVAAENKELRDQQRIFAELAGVSSTYYAELANAQKQRAAGVITEQQYVTAVQSLIEKQPFAVALAKEQAEATRAQAKAAEEASRSYLKYLDSFNKGADSAERQVATLQAEEQAIILASQGYYSLAQAVEMVSIARLKEQQIGLLGNEEAYLAVQREIEAREKLVGLIGSREARKASEDAAKDAQRDWERAAADIERSLTDSLLRGFESGKDFAKNLRDTVINMFETMVLRPVISAIVNPVAGAVTGMMGLSGAAQAGQGGAGGANTVQTGFSALNSSISSTIGDAFSKFAGSSTGQSLGLSNTTYAAGPMGPVAPGTELTATGQQMSQALGVVGDTLAGYAMGSMTRSLISNGYSAGKGMDTFQNVGIAVGSAIGGPLVGAIIGAGAGVFNQLFGRKLKDSGIQGTFGGTAGFEGEKYEFYKGGVFRSDKTKTSPLDQDTTDGLTQQFRAIQLSTGLMAETLGLASGAVASFTKDIKLSFKGLTEEQIQEKMAAEFTAISDEMAGQVLGTQAQSEYAKASETASQTLTRLSTSLITVNSAFELLGVTMLDASLASGDMASRLIEQSGGGEAFAANLGTYYDNFYSEAEKTANVTRSVSDALAAVGLAMPTTRDEFRALVESQIALGESGTQAVAALLGVSGAFASVTPAAVDASEAARQLAEEQARAAKAAQDAAYNDFRRAVDRDRSAMQDQASMLADTIGSIADAVSILKSNARELYGTVDSTAQMLAAQGMVYIENALAGVRAGGSVADYTGLSDAIGAARGGIDSGTYATQFERDRDALVLAGQLNTLADLGDTQLIFEERQLNALKEQLDYLDRLGKLAEAQVNGTEALTETVQTYFDQLLLLFAPSTQTGSGKSSASSGGGPSFGVGSGSGSDGGSGVPDFGTGAYEGWLAYMGMYAGWTAEEVDRLKVEPPDRLVDGEPVWDDPRKFALGGTFTNGIVSRPTNFNIGQMGEAGSEGILPLANVGGRLGVYAMNAGGGNAELIAEIRALRAEVAALRAPAEATAANTQPLPQLGRQFDTVSNGGTVLRNKALA